MQNADFTEGDSFSDQVQVDLDMLSSLMLKVDSTDIITIDQCCSTKRTTKLLQKLAQPAGFSYSIGDGLIFGLCAGPRHCRLTLRRPGDEIVPEK